MAIEMTRGVRWCPACVAKAQRRGTVRAVPNERSVDDEREPRTLLVLWYGDRTGGELWSVIPNRGDKCAACGDVLAMAFEVRNARKGRGLGRSPSEGAQRPLPLDLSRKHGA